jgi:hypothetical protein
LPEWTGYNLHSSGFVPCKPCTLHYYVKNLGQGGEAGRSCQGGRLYRIQPPVQWFCSLHTLCITLLRKKSGTRRRSREKLPGWTGYNLQSSGFVPSKPCISHYYVRSLGQEGGAGRSCQGVQDTTSSPGVSFLANPVNYIIM